MFQEFEFECPGGYIRYEIKNDKALITGFGGRPFEMDIPDMLNGCPVTEVSKKALFGAKLLKRVSLPGSVERIGEWAFASDSALESFEIRDFSKAGLQLGNGIFSKDEALVSLRVLRKEDADGHMAHLAAAAATTMDAQYLLEGSDFYKSFDAKLLSILGVPDDEGFVFMVLCGEEDLTADIDEYKEEQRKRKAQLCFLRLIYDTALENETRCILEGYLNEHTCGCESKAAFEVLKDHADDEKYQKLFFDIGMLKDDNFSDVLNELGDRYAPLKSKVLNSHKVSNDFFDEFEL